MLKSGILLSLRQVGGKRTRKLWLAADSMDQRDWRSLRQALLHAAAAYQRHDR